MFLFVSPNDLRVASFGLIDEGHTWVHLETIETRPEHLLASCLEYLRGRGIDPASLLGVVVVVGPGSSTALRAGLTIVNTLAWRYELPLFEVENALGSSVEMLIEHINWGASVKRATPRYGHGPRITEAKKKEG